MSLINLFSTPIYVHDFEGETLAGIQDQISKIIPRVDSSIKTAPWGEASGTTWNNQGNHVIEDYQLDKFALALIDAGAQYLTDMEYQGGGVRLHQSWFAWNKRGGFQFDHLHPMSRVSGVYYYQTNGEDGNLQFINPQLHQQMGVWPCDGMIMPNNSFEPKVGRMILWPSWLMHRVEPNCTDHDRISLNFTLV